MGLEVFYDLENIENKQKMMSELIVEMKSYNETAKTLSFGSENEGSTTGPCANQMKLVNTKISDTTLQMATLMEMVYQCIKDQAKNMQEMDEYLAQQRI